MAMKLIVVGTGGHARVVYDAIVQAGMFKVVGFLDDFLPVGHLAIDGVKVLGGINEFAEFDCGCCFVAVGDNAARDAIVLRLRSGHPDFINVVHPSAQVSRNAFLDGAAGAFIGAGASIGPNSFVGSFSIINTHASLDHDSFLGAFSHLAPGAHTGGHVKIGNHTLIGIGASIRDHTSVGSNVTVGMGSVVVRDIPDGKIGYGNPWKSVATK